MVTGCFLKCKKVKACLSFNYFEKTGICELNAKSHEETGTVLADKDGWQYNDRNGFTTEPDWENCNEKRCNGHGVCDLEDKCICFRGYKGSKCETIEDVDGKWGPWEVSSACSVTCGSGSQLLKRKCLSKTSGEAVSESHCFGKSTFFQSFQTCEKGPCPSYDKWGAWGQCSTATKCGLGSQIRSRPCLFNGKTVPNSNCTGVPVETKSCEMPGCREPLSLVNGKTFGAGRVTVYDNLKKEHAPLCGDGLDQVDADIICKQIVRQGARSFTFQPLDGSSSQHVAFSEPECKGDEASIQSCLHAPWYSKTEKCSKTVDVECIVDGGAGPWSKWGVCSHTCGQGTLTRTRKCDQPAPARGGKPCADLSQSKPCTGLKPCPIHGQWNEWATWQTCNVTCGGGIRFRHRTCTDHKHGGEPCPDNSKDSEACNTHHCPVDGYHSQWSSWDSCSVPCGGGIQNRTRECIPPKYKGEPCEEVVLLEKRKCNEQECPLHARLEQWGSWEACSVTCGPGSRKRSRTCTEGKHGGSKCADIPDPLEESEECNDKPCPVDAQYPSWGQWESCSVTCGTGSRKRSRDCIPAKHGGQECEPEKKKQIEACVQPNCPVDAKYSPWGEWKDCPVTCGEGDQVRKRSCIEQTDGGATCRDLKAAGQLDYEKKACDVPKCPIHAAYKPWKAWGACSVTCGNGTQTRSRECTPPQYDGMTCRDLEAAGDKPTEMRDCKDKECPVDASYGPWKAWGVCSTTCGPGTQTRSRECTEQMYGGKSCKELADSGEPATEDKPCNLRSCAVDATYKPWGAWGACSQTCGDATQTRSRECIEQKHGGKSCKELADDGQLATDTRACNDGDCPNDARYSMWSAWGSCSVSCGDGTQTRSRTCTEGNSLGKSCKDLEDLGHGPSENRPCKVKECPIDGKWKPWNSWTTCTKTCGGGTRNRTRVCIPPQHAGKPCEGDKEQQEECKTQPCPVDGVWKSWASWEKCTKTCGGGKRQRTRECTKPMHGGKPCEGDNTDEEECKKDPCPVDGRWKTWGAWNTCSKTCGGGKKQRNRTCTEPQHGGKPCQGSEDQEINCNTDPCPVDCVWNDWGNWSACDVSCGGGQMKRTRDSIPAQHGGKVCDGKPFEMGSCNTKKCPDPGVWEPWQSWSRCSVTCGPSGVRTRSRTCNRKGVGETLAPCIGNATDVDNGCHSTVSCTTLYATCSDIKEAGIKDSGLYMLDPDGRGQQSGYKIYCDMEMEYPAGQANGVAIYDHDTKNPLTHKTSRVTRNINYYPYKVEQEQANVVSEYLLQSITTASLMCKQYIELNCSNYALHTKGNTNVLWHAYRTGAPMSYWGGASDRSSRKCACAKTSSCAGGKDCNCDALAAAKHTDAGYLPNKADLPIKRIRVSAVTDASVYSVSAGVLLCTGTTEYAKSNRNTLGASADTGGSENGEDAYDLYG